MTDLSKLTVRADQFDAAAWAEMREELGLDEKLSECAGKLGTCEELSQDVFATFYKYLPEVRPEEEVHPSFRFNRGLVEKAMEMPEWNRLRNYTRLDPLTAAMSTSTIVESVVGNMSDDDRKKAKDQAAEAGKLQQQLDQMRDLMNDTPEQVPDQDGQPQPNPAHEAAKQQLQQAEQAMAGLEARMRAHDDATTPAVRVALKQGMQQATEEARSGSELVAGYGTEPGQMQRMPVKDRIALAKKLRGNPKLRRVAIETGRVRRLAFAMQQHRIKKVPVEVTSVTSGSSVEDALVSEIALLADPETEDLFWHKLARDSLLQHEYSGREKIGKGPIICCYDGSASMNGVPEIWAKAVTLVLADLARSQGRDFAAIQFGSASQLKDWRLPREMTTHQRVAPLMEIAEFWFAGGTDFEAPLTRAMDVLKESRFNKADIIFITDGECAVTPAWLAQYRAAKKSREFRTWGILVGATPPTVMRDLCDTVVTCVEMTSNDAGDLDRGLFVFDNVLPP